MFRLVNFKDSKLSNFILFDSNEFKPEDFNLEDYGEIESDKLESDYQFIPILSLNDFLLRSIRPKERTISHILSECGIENYKSLLEEKKLIDSKQSKLSKSQRDNVLIRLNQINRT